MSINEASGVSPYLQVAEALRSAIRAGDLEVDDKVPTARELAEQHTVSLTTAVRAIDELRRDGLIETKRGRGSFVRAKPAMVRRGAQRYMRTNKQLPNTDLEAVTGYDIADRDLARRLGVDVGDDLSRVDYFWCTDDSRPLQLSTQWEPLRLTAGTAVEQPDITGAHTVIERFDSIGIHVDHVDEDISTRMPSTVESQRLAMPPATPVFQIVRTHWAGDLAVETASIVIRGDRIVVNFTHPVPPT